MLAVICIAAIASLLSGCSNRTAYLVIGIAPVDAVQPGTMVTLSVYRNDGRLTANSAAIDGQGRFEFSGSVKYPCLAEMRMLDASCNRVPALRHFYIENSRLVVRVDTAVTLSRVQYDIKVAGSRTDKQFRKEYCKFFKNHLAGVGMNAYQIAEYVSSHGGSIFAPVLYYMCGCGDYRDNGQWDLLRRQLETFTGDARNTYHYRLMEKGLLAAQQGVAH